MAPVSVYIDVNDPPHDRADKALRGLQDTLIVSDFSTAEFSSVIARRPRARFTRRRSASGLFELRYLVRSPCQTRQDREHRYRGRHRPDARLTFRFAPRMRCILRLRKGSVASSSALIGPWLASRGHLGSLLLRASAHCY